MPSWRFANGNIGQATAKAHSSQAMFCRELAREVIQPFYRQRAAFAAGLLHDLPAG
jgi:alanine-alpha-ketoisovalerate/valine-pyruvate aminotransferase